MTVETCRWIDFAPALLLGMVAFLSVFAAQVLGAFGTPIETLPQMAVIFPPWVDLGEAVTRIAQADGRLVRQGLFDNIVVAAANDSGFVTRLYQNGAILVVDPIVLGGCWVGEPTP